MKFILLFSCVFVTISNAFKLAATGTQPAEQATRTNRYKQIALGLIEEFKEDHKNLELYRKCTPHEWRKDKSRDIKKSSPKLQNSYEFLKNSLAESLKDANLGNSCSSPEGIIKIQEYLKKNLSGGPKPKDNVKPVVASPAAKKRRRRRNRVKFLQFSRTNILRIRKKALMKPFEDILKHMNNFHSALKTIVSSPLFDRVRFIISCLKYRNNVAKTREDLQLQITNFTTNLYKLLDKDLDEFIERIVAVYCDKDKNLLKSMDYFSSYLTETDQLKKFNLLGKFFARLIISLSK